MNSNIFKILITLFFILNQSALAEGTSSSSGGGSRPWLLSKGAAAREAKRFNLYDYIDNKNRNQMMDMWLSLNTPSPFEFSLSGSYNQYDRDQNSNANSFRTYESQFSAYAKFVGLTAEHINNSDEGFTDNTGLFNLRLFGETLQGSQLTLHYGLKTRSAHDGSYRLNQQFAAGTLELYLMKYFGLCGHYRQYSPIDENYYGHTETTENSFGAFIDFGALRVMGKYFNEKQKSDLNGTTQNINRNGSKISLVLFF